MMKAMQKPNVIKLALPMISIKKHSLIYVRSNKLSICRCWNQASGELCNIQSVS